MTNKIVSIIPARGGSKGLPRKNIVDLSGLPLISWTINASLKSKYIDRTIVSSDDAEILEIAQNHGAEIIHRPSNLASDSSTSEVVLEHALNVLDDQGTGKIDYIVLLQPTSPLRSCNDIDAAFEKLLKKKGKCVN